MKWLKGDAARPGAVFKGTTATDSGEWTTKCTVTDAEPGQAFAFDVGYFGIRSRTGATTSQARTAVAA